MLDDSTLSREAVLNLLVSFPKSEIRFPLGIILLFTNIKSKEPVTAVKSPVTSTSVPDEAPKRIELVFPLIIAKAPTIPVA